MASKYWTIGDLLKVTADYLKRRGIPDPRLNAEVLLAHQLHVDRMKLYLNFDQPLTDSEISGYRSLVGRRLRREPLQYITGIQEFWSLEFIVNPGVLIPRPESELLVEQGLERIRAVSWPEERPPRLLDLGTGSGAVAVSLSRERPEAQIWATDVSSEALKLACLNAERHGVKDRIRFRLGDLWEALAHDRMSFDLILSNPPYVAGEDYDNLPPEVRDYEPRGALDGHEEGMYFIEKIIGSACDHMNPGGWLLLEMAPDQTEKALRLIERNRDFSEKRRVKDYSRRYRVVMARKFGQESFNRRA